MIIEFQREHSGHDNVCRKMIVRFLWGTRKRLGAAGLHDYMPVRAYSRHYYVTM